jgi:hypothetical protein
MNKWYEVGSVGEEVLNIVESYENDSITIFQAITLLMKVGLSEGEIMTVFRENNA